MKLFLMGGFLGSGKTTAIKMAAEYYISIGKGVGVITNDQGTQLVDTEFMQKNGVPSREVTDGCFCCNYDQLDNNISQLRALSDTDVIFAESVGSCTDLIATIAKPMEQYHSDIDVVISVFADVQVLPSLLQGARLFKDSVRYIYNKQLDEADILVVNKVDTVSEEALEGIKQLIKRRYPDKMVLYQNSLDLNDITSWLKSLETFKPVYRRSLELDYLIYGQGEAELAWLDLRLEIYAEAGEAFGCASRLIDEIYSGIADQRLSVGHLKFMIDDGIQSLKLSYTMGTKAADIDMTSTSQKIDMLINARIQTEPENLQNIVYGKLDKLKSETGCEVIISHVSVFKPGFPRPTHRILS